jgi:putative spermidine/putrescine transport system ATP-binding protein
VPPNRRDIGMVFQSYALFPHLSIAENVAFPLKVRGRPRAETGIAVRRALALVGLSDKADRLPRQLSGGQQQRVALARALVYEPKLLLLDEPLSALDKNLREQMQIELRRVHRTVGITTLYVTHDQTEAMTLSDRVVVFNGGRIEQVGAPLDVYARPVSRFAATFVGDSSILDGHVGAAPTDLVMAEGARVRSPHPLLAGTDGAASLLVRPEHIHLGPPPAGLAHNALTVRVTGVLNVGSGLLVVAQHGDCEIRIRCAVAEREAAVEGSLVPVWWAPEHSWPIPPAAASARVSP